MKTTLSILGIIAAIIIIVVVVKLKNNSTTMSEGDTTIPSLQDTTTADSTATYPDGSVMTDTTVTPPDPTFPTTGVNPEN